MLEYNTSHLLFGRKEYFIQLVKEHSAVDKPDLKWCAPDCPHASFPEKEHLGGACHTFTALYCSKYNRLVQKSALCLDLNKDMNKGRA